MLGTELLLWGLLMRIVHRAVGAPPLLATVGSPFAAGLAMAGTVALLASLPLLALAAGAAVYAVVFGLVERRVAPDDLDALLGMLPGGIGARLRPRLAQAR